MSPNELEIKITRKAPSLWRRVLGLWCRYVGHRGEPCLRCWGGPLFVSGTIHGLCDPFRGAPLNTHQGFEDIPIILLNGNRIVLQRTGEGTAVYDGEPWIQTRPDFWVKRNGIYTFKVR